MKVQKKDLDRILRSLKGRIAEKDYEDIRKILAAYQRARRLVQVKGMTPARLRRLLFGPRERQSGAEPPGEEENLSR